MLDARDAPRDARLNRTTPRPPIGAEPCRAWVYAGGCPMGAACAFAHDPVARAANVTRVTSTSYGFLSPYFDGVAYSGKAVRLELQRERSCSARRGRD